MLDQGDTTNFFLVDNSPGVGPFAPAIDFAVEFETLASPDPDYGVIVHRFMGQAETSNFNYPANTVHDSVTAGVEYNDYPPVDENGDGTFDRRFIYGPTVVEVGLNLPGRLTGAPGAVIEHLIDDFNPPKPGPFSNPNGEDFLISLGFGSSTPINSGFGARFQHVYRATDASPAKNDFTGVVLDLVGLAWSPFNDTVNNTVLNDFSLLVGLSHANRGRGPNTNQTNGIPADGGSGLGSQFDCNRLEHRANCCEDPLTGNLAANLAANPRPETTTLVKRGTPYTISSSNLFKPLNSGLTPGAFNLYLDYPTFNDGIDPVFGKDNVFSYPYDSTFPMLVEYSIGPNETPPPLNLYRFSPGIQTSVLPRFRVWSQGQHPAAHGVPNWSLGVGGCPQNQPGFFRAGEGGPLVEPGTFNLPIEPPDQNNGQPTILPADYITPPRMPNPTCAQGSVSLQPTRDPSNGEVIIGPDPMMPPAFCGCITRMPTASTNPLSNYYFANGMLVNPLPNFNAWPGPIGIPPTFWYGYGIPVGGIGPPTGGGFEDFDCLIPGELGFDNEIPSAGSNEPGMSSPPAIFGDNNRYYMMWKYRKRVSVVESPTVQVAASRVVFERPIVLPPVTEVDPAASLAVDFKAGRQLDFAVAQLESGYVRSDEPAFSEMISGPDLDYIYVKFRASFGVAPNATQPPVLDSIAIPYRKLAP
jgi:hypothetical protein